MSWEDFLKENNDYSYKKKINNRFLAEIKIEGKKMTSQIIDCQTNEEYILVDIKNSTGNYVGKIREEYEKLLEDILSHCTDINIFKSKQAQELIKEIRKLYQNELEYLWPSTPNNAIWRNNKSNKWYAVLLTIPKNRLDKNSSEIVEILNLRVQKEKINDLIDNKIIFPGYHMNKKSWITIILDGSMKLKEIMKLIENSYNLSLK